MSTLKNWLSRKPRVILLGDTDWEKAGESQRFAFSFVRVMQIAITAELCRLGLPPQKAGSVAMWFTDVGETGGGWSGDPVKETRNPGYLFSAGATILVAHHDKSESRLVNVKGNLSIPLSEVFQGGSPSAALVNVNEIDRRVRTALNLDYGWGLA